MANVEIVKGEERVERKPVKKHKRRSALKFLGKVAVGAALWGTGGYLAGRIFKYTAKPVVDTLLGTSERVSGAYRGLKRLLPGSAPAPVQATRRGFLSSLVRTSYRHPVAAGTVAGVTYGAGKYALGGMSKYLSDRQTAILMDETADYKQRVNVLEKYKEGLEEDLKGRDAKIEYLEGEVKKVNEIIRRLEKPNKLEKVAIEEGTPEETKEMLLAFGITGLLISFAISSMNLTGNVIGGLETSKMFSATVAFFIISLGLILYGADSKNH